MPGLERWKQPLRDYDLVLIAVHNDGQHNIRHGDGGLYEAVHSRDGDMVENFPTEMPEGSLNQLLETSDQLALVPPSETPFDDLGEVEVRR